MRWDPGNRKAKILGMGPLPKAVPRTPTVAPPSMRLERHTAGIVDIVSSLVSEVLKGNAQRGRPSLDRSRLALHCVAEQSERQDLLPLMPPPYLSVPIS